jgi:hypothetical protein
MTAAEPRRRAICIGGPSDRWVYWEDELEARRDREKAAGNEYHYVQTGKTWVDNDGNRHAAWDWDGSPWVVNPSTFEPDLAYWHSADSPAHE